MKAGTTPNGRPPQNGAVSRSLRRSAARVAVVLRWTSRLGVAAGSLPNGQPTGGDDEPAPGARPPKFGHPLLRLWTDVLHFLRSGATADTSVSLYRRRWISDGVPFLPVGILLLLARPIPVTSRARI